MTRWQSKAAESRALSDAAHAAHVAARELRCKAEAGYGHGPVGHCVLDAGHDGEHDAGLVWSLTA